MIRQGELTILDTIMRLDEGPRKIGKIIKPTSKRKTNRGKERVAAKTPKRRQHLTRRDLSVPEGSSSEKSDGSGI